MVAATDPEELLVTWLRSRYPVGDGTSSATLLNEALDASETAVDVDDGSLFVSGDVIVVDREQMLVTDRTGNTLTVERGYNSSVAAIHADNAEVWVFKSRRFKLAQPLQPQAVDNFPGKVTIGAYNIDSNDLLSAWVISDLTGGHGIAEHDEGVTDNRYRFGNLYTRYPKQWTKPFSISISTIGSGSVFPLGDMLYSGTVYRMTASGAELYQNTTDRGALTNAPASTGIMFRGTGSQALFYIPQGNGGYSTFNPATNTLTNNNTGGDPNVRCFVKWDEKLLALDNDGTIYYATAAAGTTVFTAYTLGGSAVRLDDDFAMKKMHVFYNRNGESTPYVVTSGEVWAFDADTPRFYKIPDFESVHPYFGIASAVWRGELYVASGMDILAFNGEVIRLAASLSRDDGLPYSYQDRVVGFASGQNALYALVQGHTSGGNTTHSVHEWSGFGWHCLYTTVSANTPTVIVISAAGDTYKLHWGVNNSGTLYTQTLPVTFTNPREAIAAGGIILGDFTVTTVEGGDTYYTKTYYLETGKFDANMAGYRKIGNAVEMDVSSIAGDYETIRLYYRIDDETAWTLMYHTDGGAPSGTTVTTSGHHTFELGHYDPTGHYLGIDFEAIEFRIEVEDHIPNPYVQSTSVVISSIVFNFLKLMNPSLAWTAQIDLLNTYHDAAPQNMLDELTEVRTLPRFFSIQHKDRTYRARMTGMSSIEFGGQDEAASAQISLLEIPGVLGLAMDS